MQNLSKPNLSFQEMEEKSAEIVDYLKLLSHQQRLLILCHLLHEGKKTAGEIVEFTKLSQSATSQHLALLREAEVVETNREGNSIYYQIKDKKIALLLSSFSQIFCQTL